MESVSTWQHEVTCSRSSRRARCTRDFIPEVEMPSCAAACRWVWPSRSTRVSASRATGWSRLEHRLETAGELAGGVVREVVGPVRVGPALQVGVRLVDASGPVVVDDGVTGRAVEPGTEVVDAVQRPRGDGADQDVLGDVGGDLRVLDAGGDEATQPVEGLAPVLVTTVDGALAACAGHRPSFTSAHRRRRSGSADGRIFGRAAGPGCVPSAGRVRLQGWLSHRGGSRPVRSPP